MLHNLLIQVVSKVFHICYLKKNKKNSKINHKKQRKIIQRLKKLTQQKYRVKNSAKTDITAKTLYKDEII